MKAIFNNLASLILPVTVLIIVPIGIERSFYIKSWELVILGLPLVLLGFYLVVTTTSSFIRIRKGTLAPWSPPCKLITTGVYSYVRNPMIIGVLTLLMGESVIFLSIPILLWAILFFIINNLYFIVFEEPQLRRR